MKKLYIFLIILLLLTACSGEKQETTTQNQRAPPASRSSLNIDDIQIGVNFIRFYSGVNDKKGELNLLTSFTQPDTIFKDFEALNIQAYRQLTKVDLLWSDVEPQKGQWTFDTTDSVLMYTEKEPIVTLFSIQYASPNPPWAKKGDAFQKTLGPEATEYVTKVVERYSSYVKYWEIGNEMDHWRIMEEEDRSAITASGAELDKIPVNAGIFTPEEQGKFLAEAAALIREKDPDAVILLSGMGGLDDYNLNTWLKGVIEGGGTEWFDIVNYHYYPSWEPYTLSRTKLTNVLKTYEIQDKPVWLTETGVTSLTSLTVRTNYPNSEDTQAADIFRRIIQAYGLGDDCVMWHTYIGSPAETGNIWADYGIISNTGVKKKAYYSFKLLANELIPFESVTMTSSGDVRKENVYKIITKESKTKYVAWGTGTVEVPDGITQMTSVVPNESGEFDWQTVSSDQEITLNAYPILMK